MDIHYFTEGYLIQRQGYEKIKNTFGEKQKGWSEWQETTTIPRAEGTEKNLVFSKTNEHCTTERESKGPHTSCQ